MRLDINPNTSETSKNVSFSRKVSVESGSNEVLQALRHGIEAAKSGNRNEARVLLMRVAEAEPKNETAWLWLASISEYPEELLVFLQNVLSINPENQRAIEWTNQTKSLLAKNVVQRGITASQENQKDIARQCFLQAIAHDNKNEMAWLWLASIVDSAEEKISHLKKVLSINAENETAISSLKLVKNQMAQAILKKANQCVVVGDRETARNYLQEAMKHDEKCEEVWLLKAHLADSFDEKVCYFNKVLELNPENEAAKGGLISIEAVMKSVIVEPKAKNVYLEEKVEAFSQTEIQHSIEESFAGETADEVEEVAVEQSDDDDDEFLLEIAEPEVAEQITVAQLREIVEQTTVKEVTEQVETSVEPQSRIEEVPAESEVEVVTETQPEEIIAEENVEQSTEETQAEVAESVEQSAVETLEIAEEVTENVEQSFTETQEVAEEVFEQAVEETSVIVEDYENYVEQAIEEAPEVIEENVEQEVEKTLEQQVETVHTEVEMLSAEVKSGEITEELSQHSEPETNDKTEPTAEVKAINEIEKATESEVYKHEEDESLLEFNAPLAVPTETLQSEEVVAETVKVDVAETVTEVLRVEPQPAEFVAETPKVVEVEPVREIGNISLSNFNPAEGLKDIGSYSFTKLKPEEFPRESNKYSFSNAKTEESVEEFQPVSFEQPVYSMLETSSEAKFEPTLQVVKTLVEPVQTEVPAAVEMPQVTEILIEPAPVERPAEVFEYIAEVVEEKTETRFQVCPFCSGATEASKNVCDTCRANLNLSDLQAVLDNNQVDSETVFDAIRQMELGKLDGELSDRQYKSLGLAYLNVKDLQNAHDNLKLALHFNPMSVELNSQVMALAAKMELRDEKAHQEEELAAEKANLCHTILVVDDSPTVRKLISSKLERHGHTVVSAVDGMDALAKINEVVPDLILLDITMPRLDGYQVCKLIRNNESTKGIPIVMISGKDGFFDKVRGRMAGSTDFISKPFGPETLMKMLELHIH